MPIHDLTPAKDFEAAFTGLYYMTVDELRLDGRMSTVEALRLAEQECARWRKAAIVMSMDMWGIWRQTRGARRENRMD